jgi:acyl-coenzyme A thioesterase PaaI-like protein
LSIRYRKPVPVETPLKLTGRVVEDKGKVITWRVKSTDQKAMLLAEGDAVLVEVDHPSLANLTRNSAELAGYPEESG